MKVLFFAQCREAAGCDEGVLRVENPVTKTEFWAALVDAFPGMDAHQKTARLARRESYLQDGELLYPMDEIAVIPPVAGG